MIRLVRIDTILRPLFTQSEALVDAKPVLFINNHQQQILKLALRRDQP